MDVLLFTTRLSIIACRYMVPFFYSNKYVKASDIAQLYGFNVRSLSPSLTALSRAGILISRVGGRDRGFIFKRDPQTITLYDIVVALEGEEDIQPCDDMLTCSPAQCTDCSVFIELKGVIDERRKILSSTSIYKHYKELKKL